MLLGLDKVSLDFSGPKCYFQVYDDAIKSLHMVIKYARL